jgi:multimeric flavodoxin WrbA
MNPAIIFGSARRFGNTRKAVDEILGHAGLPLFDLHDFDITPYDYEHLNRNDDFIGLIEKLVAHDTWVIATPVYWYSMSTQHKIFIDRFSDLITIRKDLGRKLRGKKLFVIASFNSSYPKGFEDTFEQICQYFEMNYLGTSFIYGGDENAAFLQNNILHAAKARAALEII